MDNRMRYIGLSVGFGILIIALGVFLSPSRDSGKVAITPTGAVPSKSPEKTTVYQKFVESGKSEVCRYEERDRDVVVSWTTYATQGKVRADLEGRAPNGIIKRSFIADLHMAYIWTDSSDKGIKMALKEANAEELQKVGGMDRSKFICHDEAIDLKLFEPPANINFGEISAKARPGNL